MTTPTGEGPGWSVPERSAQGGWGPPPGGPAAPATPVAPAPTAGPGTGGWGQVSGAGQQPYGSVLTRRGIIALKPLGFGDFFDGSFRAIRHNPRVMVGLSALVLVTTNILLSLPLVGMVTAGGLFDPTASAEPSDDQLLAMGGSLLALIPAGFVQSMALVVLVGILILSVTQSVVDRRLPAGELWGRAKGRVWPLIGWSVLVSLGGALLFALALTPGIVLLVLEEFVGGAVALLVLLPAAAVLALWLYVLLTFVPVVIVVERLGIRAAVRRSVALVRGAFWRTLGILLLTSILASTVSQFLSTPFAIVGGVGVALLESNPALAGVVYAASVSLGSTVGLVLAVPFLAAVVALLYIDRRIRLEGLDVALARTLEDGPA